MAKSSEGRIRQSIIVYSALSILVIGLVVSLVSILPLHSRLKKNAEDNLLHDVKIRAIAVDEFISRAKDIALQITSRTQIRKKLESYNRGEINLNILVRFTQGKLADAMNLSEEVAGMNLFPNVLKQLRPCDLPSSKKNGTSC